MVARQHSILASVFVTAFAVLFALNVSLQLFLVNQRPHYPEVSSGKIYPLHVHGLTVYVNYIEHLLSGPLTWGLAAVSGITYVVCARAAKRAQGN
jgi:hypothetical protein